MGSPLEELLEEAREEGSQQGRRHTLAVARRHPRVLATRLPMGDVSPQEAALRLAIEEMTGSMDMEGFDVE